jgi:MFS transporter, DHA2 family, multidrug resistance protein
VFVLLSTLTFATLNAKFRSEATSMFSLVRNVGSGVGISLVTTVLARMSVVNHEELGASLTATSPQVQMQMPQLIGGSKALLAQADQLVSQQAAMIGYVDNFLLMMYLTLAVFPIVLFLRKPPTHAPAAEAHAVME